MGNPKACPLKLSSHAVILFPGVVSSAGSLWSEFEKAPLGPLPKAPRQAARQGARGKGRSVKKSLKKSLKHMGEDSFCAFSGLLQLAVGPGKLREHGQHVFEIAQV